MSARGGCGSERALAAAGGEQVAPPKLGEWSDSLVEKKRKKKKQKKEREKNLKKEKDKQPLKRRRCVCREPREGGWGPGIPPGRRRSRRSCSLGRE